MYAVMLIRHVASGGLDVRIQIPALYTIKEKYKSIIVIDRFKEYLSNHESPLTSLHKMLLNEHMEFIRSHFRFLTLHLTKDHISIVHYV